MPELDCDVLIVGGGPVGLTLLHALAASPFKVLLVDRRSLAAQTRDPRALALSHGARQLLEPLQAWPQHASAIASIHISQSGGFGRTLLEAQDFGLPALGYVVRFGELAGTLQAALQKMPAQHAVLENTSVSAIEPFADGVRVEIDNSGNRRTLRTRLLVHAEGSSTSDGMLVEHDYRQVAIITEASTRQGHGHRAWERFTPDGPLALLPVGDKLSVVFTVPAAKAEGLMALDDTSFLAALQEQFGSRLQFTTTGPRHSFPLNLKLRRTIAGDRQIWIGNAAQTLHPVSGQGYNLGLRDAIELAGLLQDNPQDVGAASVLRAHARQRQLDRLGSAAFTDGIVRLFSNDLPPLRIARGAGLLALDLCPPLRNFVARRMIWGARAW